MNRQKNHSQPTKKHKTMSNSTMTMTRIMLLIYILSIFLLVNEETNNKLEIEKSRERGKLTTIANTALNRIRKTSETKAGDYLQLLPTLTVSRSAPTSDIQGSETYIVRSINLNRIFSISDVSNKHVK